MKGLRSWVGIVMLAGCRFGFDAADASVSVDAPDVPIDACTGCLAPSNGIDVGLLSGVTGDLAVPELDFDTESGRIADTGGNTIRAAGTGVIGGIRFTIVDGMGVFSARTFTVPVSAGWSAGGVNTWVLFAESITVNGEIDAGGYLANAGPGGEPGGIGSPPASACTGRDGAFKFSNNAGAGAGGAGGTSAGGGGAATAADVNGATSGGAAGAACAQPSTRPLRGGAGGGAGGTESMIIRGGAGGGGGGGVALVAMNQVTVAGRVISPGDGGACNAGASGGGGGGAGGAIFIESIAITIAGPVTANGGAGGPPAATGTTVFGERGHPNDALPAAGITFGAGRGGNGAAGAIAPTSGTTNTSGAPGGGGGGGGATGRIEIRSLTAPDVTGATFSPSPSMTQAVLQ